MSDQKPPMRGEFCDVTPEDLEILEQVWADLKFTDEEIEESVRQTMEWWREKQERERRAEIEHEQDKIRRHNERRARRRADGRSGETSRTGCTFP